MALGASPLPTWKGSCAFKASPTPGWQGERGEELDSQLGTGNPAPAGEQQEGQPWSQVSWEGSLAVPQCCVTPKCS